jgi:hypothetical protein
MTFLKKAGQFILKSAAALAGFAPLGAQLFPQHAGAIARINEDLQDIAGVVISVEALGQLQGIPGAHKARLAGPLVAQVILRSSVVANRKIEDPALFAKGCQQIGTGMADILNSLKGDVETV